MIMLSFQKLDVFVMLTWLEISVAFLCIHKNTFFCGLPVCKTSKSHVAEEKAFWVQSDISNVGGELVQHFVFVRVLAKGKQGPFHGLLSSAALLLPRRHCCCSLTVPRQGHQNPLLSSRCPTQHPLLVSLAFRITQNLSFLPQEHLHTSCM